MDEDVCFVIQIEDIKDDEVVLSVMFRSTHHQNYIFDKVLKKDWRLLIWDNAEYDSPEIEKVPRL